MNQQPTTEISTIARGGVAFLLHALVFVALLAMFVFCVPIHEQVYMSLGIQLTAQAERLISLSSYVLKFWYLALLGFVVADVALVAWCCWLRFWRALTLLNYAVLVAGLLAVVYMSLVVTAPLQLAF